MAETPQLTAVSLFSGTGGFDWGAQEAGAKIIWANDNDPAAAAGYQTLLPDVEFVLADIEDVEKFPEADVLIGCYPCTGFSLGARRRHYRTNEIERDLKADSGNFLYREFLRALKQIKPKYLFVENVKGMLTAAGGWFLEQQLKGFREAGYRVQYELLEAQDFGVPQSRRRIFIVGVRDDIDWAYTFPEPTHGAGREHPYTTLRDAIGEMPRWPTGEFFDYGFHGHFLTRQRKRGWHELSYTVVADMHHVPLHPMGEPMRYIKKDTWELQGDENRRLSWRECAAIQGIPEKAAVAGNLSEKHRVVGNAVPPALGRVLLNPVVQFENGSDMQEKPKRPPPRSSGDPLSEGQRSQVMASIKSKDTTPELALRKALWAKGHRYLKHHSAAGASIDVAFTRPKVGVFVDGCFWHGCPRHYSTPGTNSKYWKKKIDRNRDRDQRNTTALQESGWKVLRFWECRVKEDLAGVLQEIERLL